MVSNFNYDGFVVRHRMFLRRSVSSVTPPLAWREKLSPVREVPPPIGSDLDGISLPSNSSSSSCPPIFILFKRLLWHSCSAMCLTWRWFSSFLPLWYQCFNGQGGHGGMSLISDQVSNQINLIYHSECTRAHNQDIKIRPFAISQNLVDQWEVKCGVDFEQRSHLETFRR